MKVDRLASAVVDFGEGRQLSFTCGTQASNFQRVQILGTTGRFEIEIPFNAPPDKPTLVHLHQDGKPVETREIAMCDQYTLQAEAFGRAVRGIEPLDHGVENAIRNMRVLDALFRAEMSGRWETV